MTITIEKIEQIELTPESLQFALVRVNHFDFSREAIQGIYSIIDGIVNDKNHDVAEHGRREYLTEIGWDLESICNDFEEAEVRPFARKKWIVAPDIDAYELSDDLLKEVLSIYFLYRPTRYALVGETLVYLSNVDYLKES